MEQIKISAKALGAFAMPDFCPRCAWIKLKSAILPWQIFPGIFSSIDAYTKKCVHAIIQSPCVPSWIEEMGKITGFQKVSSKVQYFDDTNGVVLTGVPDDILLCSDGSRVIPDYKTAKHTDNQDKLFPMYEAQVNGYALLHDQNAKLFLVYMVPETGEESIILRSGMDGFSLGFSPKVVPVENNRSIMDRLFSSVREIYEMKQPPTGRTGCKDCEALDGVAKLLQ